jgi:non-specific serine/threonine protein kinase
MPGGEYLSPESLHVIWGRLISWTQAQYNGKLSEFLSQRAPQWQKVGRVAFHLAENKANPKNPFAFMATYVTSLTSEGRDRHLPLGQALTQYAGESNRTALLSLLTPVRAASEKLQWVSDLVKTGAIYKPIAFSIKKAHQFLVDQPTLVNCGLTVLIPNWWRKIPRVSALARIGPTCVSISQPCFTVLVTASINFQSFYFS